MYKCLNCDKIFTELPKCNCGYEHQIINGVYQLTDMPNINNDTEFGDLYTGYDKIGQYYEGKNWREQLIDNKQRNYISSILNGGYLLDVGCGTGTNSLPLAANQNKVICTDISQVMLELLIKKAQYHNIDLNYVTPIRMNGLNLRFADNSIDMVRCDGMLHLTSNSKKILNEIYRVLKPGGKAIITSGYGKSADTNINIKPKESIDNSAYMERLNYWSKKYYEITKEYTNSRVGYQFDVFDECDKIFDKKEIIEFYKDDSEKQPVKSTLADTVIYRYKHKGFSDQQNIPDDIHERACEYADNESRLQYGDDFAQIEMISIPPDGYYINVYTK